MVGDGGDGWHGSLAAPRTRPDLPLLFIIYNAFLSRATSFRVVNSLRMSSLRMSDSDSDEPRVQMAEGELEDNSKLFDMNQNVRLGRSRDQDGKSNIWSIEPRMEVEDGAEEGDATKKNLLVAGGIIGVAVACLPLFNIFSKLLPDPADF